MADFYQDDLSGVRSSDVEGTRLESGDFIFHWDDGPNRKMVRTNNTGDFIQSGFYGGSKVGDNWKNFGSWMNGGYSIKNFRGYQYTGSCMKFSFPNIIGVIIHCTNTVFSK